ncbi:hypothetical protein NS365_19710, partial [Aureimonas ureilytica]
AEFERDLLIERTHAGLIRAKEQGKVLGRPRSLTDVQKQVVREKLGEGASVSKLSRDYGVSRQTIQRARDEVRGKDDHEDGAERSVEHS